MKFDIVNFFTNSLSNTIRDVFAIVIVLIDFFRIFSTVFKSFEIVIINKIIC